MTILTTIKGLSPLKMYLLGGLLVVLTSLVGTLFYYKSQYNSEQVKNVNLQVANNVLKENQKTLQEAMDDQNKKILEAGEKSLEQIAEMNRLQYKLAKRQIASQIKVDEMRNKPAPKGTDEAIKYLGDIIKDIQW